MGWSCTACTYLNQNTAAKICFTCETPRAARAKKPSIDLTGDDHTNENVKLASTGKRQGSGTQKTLFGGVAEEGKGKESKRAKTVKTEAKISAPKPVKAEGKASSSSSFTQSTIQTNSSIVESYNPIPNESYEVRSKRCGEVMKNVFEIDKLRKQQPKAVECALKGQSQVIVMATGGGKSLCYQLPAAVLGGVTVVISPLLALMQDQVDSLTKKGISAACINSTKKETEKIEIYDRLLGRRTKATKKSSDTAIVRPINLVYTTPESLQTDRFQSILKELNNQRRLAGFAIDEAHCLSTWGHDFRTAYRKLDYIPKNFPNVPCMALTATATHNVIKDIQKTLKLEKAPCHVGSFDRPNIFYKVHYKDGLDAIQPGGSLTDIAKFITKQHKRAKKAGKPCSGIVYVFRRCDTTMLAKEITKRTGIRAAGYHGSMKDAERTQVQKDWTSGAVEITVATIAFGMGIDLAHVRYVIHWAIPKTMDGFYQESGRAGRDGLPAISLAYFSRDDANTFSFLINKEAEKKASKGDGKGGGSALRNQEALKNVVDYCMIAQCRRACFLKHFGEKVTDPRTVCQKSCDYCSNPERVEKAIQSSDACRAISMQKKEAAKKKKSKETKWNGQWGRAHGDDEQEGWEGYKEDWEVDGLGITSSAKAKPSFLGSNKSFVKASTLAGKLDTLEAMEMQENETNGFVKFKTVKKERDIFPEHFKEQLKKIPLSTNAAKAKPKERSSDEIKQNADKLKAELAALKAKQAALLSKSSKNTKSSAPPPPPAFQTKPKHKK